MLIQILVTVGAVVCTVLGLVHILYTFYTTKFSATDVNVNTLMNTATLNITTKTTVAKAWKEFNARDSVGIIFFHYSTYY
jgi:hypothetical protein